MKGKDTDTERKGDYKIDLALNDRAIDRTFMEQ